MLDAAYQSKFTETTVTKRIPTHNVALKETARLAVSVNNKHREVLRLGRTAKEIAAEIGEELIKVKQKLAHGEFKKWVGEGKDWGHCSFSYRTAAKYMQIANAKVHDRVHFETCFSMDEVIRAKPNKEKRTATLDDLRKVEKLRAKRDDPATNDAERDAIQGKLDDIEAELGPVEPQPRTHAMGNSGGQTARHAVRLRACAVMDKVAPSLTGNPRSMLISALMVAYGDTPEKIEELLEALKGKR
ncbi:DUF3102 domain-containing protein [Pontivivens insulae]|uniref:DUF3102 domain-containing protein n=1 Tax=Pontivivens insulae TaxID=1639689 RepID=A0A2R8AA88_9RHOB|nr:DUF3102 domain-containing protein [Pontivivens insulae]RED12887.1 hypothetical protein DFR53_2020 [Pontivivens insulae]SPF28978.1 hypothetical protein POI8812_01283 [Pontivivens insulae]